MNLQTVRRWLLMLSGFLALALAMVGVFVPVLPTTPFLLLAAACFVRSSPRLYAWLIHHRWFGSHIRHYREHRAVSLTAKVTALVLLWGVIGASALFTVSALWVRLSLGAIAVAVTLHLLHLRTLTPEMVSSERRAPDGDEGVGPLSA
jgi:hypothetical protein